jgi:hypothetical protein
MYGIANPLDATAKSSGGSRMNMEMNVLMNVSQQDFTQLERLIAWLNDWARWRESYRPNLGAKSPGYWPSGIYHASDLFDDSDNFQVIESAVEDLRHNPGPASHEALLRRYGQISCFTSCRDNYADMLDKAHQRLLVVLPKRNVVL